MNGFVRGSASVVLLLLSACGTLEISVERTPTSGLDATATLAALQVQNLQLATQIATLSPPTSMPVPPPQPTPQDIMEGGTVFDGPFIFDLRMFRDPNLNRHPVAASLYSDLEGIGVWMYWFYKGPDVIGPVETYWGTLPKVDQLLQETYSSIQIGSSGGRNGGVQLPGGFFMAGKSKPGDRVRVALKAITPDGEYGALLAFTLNQGLNGLEPIDISVDVLKSLVAPTPSARLSGPTITYTDPVIGYSVDYPKAWYIQVEPGWIASLSSFAPPQNGGGQLRSDQAKIDLAPTKPSEYGSLQQLVNMTRSAEEEGQTLWEQHWLLAGETPAIRMQRRSEVFGESAVLLTVIHGRCLNVAGWGNASLFDAIVASLHPSP